jgi:hypothetical protein
MKQSFVSERSWDACSANIQWHINWQQAHSVTVGIYNMCHHNLDSSVFL